jgi:glycosyltransferase involved in cell wall biosynthesis
MKIIYHHRTRGSGAEGVHITGVSEALKSLAHEVEILSFPGANPDINKADSPSSSKLKSSKLSLMGCLGNLTRKMPQSIFELCEVAYNLLAFPRLYRVIKNTKAELIYERYSMFMFAGALLAKLAKKQIVIEVNDSVLVEDRVRPLYFKTLAKKIEEWVFSNVDGIVFISSYFQALANKNYPDIAKSCVSPNAANLEHFKPSAIAKVAAKIKLNLNDKVVIGYLGAFVHWHGIDWFVESIVHMLNEHSNLVLLLVGDGVEYDRITNLVAEAGVSNQVILTGRVPHTEVSQYISAMDFGVLPDSNMYGSPMKLFELMAMGVGMVVPDYAPISEVITDNKNGWLFPASDRVECIKRVLHVANSTEEQLTVGDAARKYIETERTWKHNALDMLNLIKKPTISADGKISMDEIKKC